MHEDGFSKLRRWRGVLFLALFLVGLVLQAVGPHPKIKDNRFVLPPSLLSAGKQVSPTEIIARERRMQWLSGLLTLGGALGLALCYGKVVFGTCSPQRDLASGSQGASTSSRIVE